MAILSIKNIHFSYEDNQILTGIDLNILKGEVLCLLGPNGCGKTTLLDCILGVHRPISGEILLDGVPINEMKPSEVAKWIAYVPQKNEHTFPYTTLEMVLMGRTPFTGMFQSPSKEDVEIAENALEEVGMQAFKDRSFNSLSGGEAQLVKIARAIAQKTKIIIFDEPTSHLDFINELTTIEYIVDVVKRNKMTVIMATHFPNHAFMLRAKKIPTKVAIMKNGEILKYGEAETVISEENMAEIFNIDSKKIDFNVGANKYQWIIPIEPLNN